MFPRRRMNGMQVVSVPIVLSAFLAGCGDANRAGPPSSPTASATVQTPSVPQSAPKTEAAAPKEAEAASVAEQANPEPTKAKRSPIYDETASGSDLIAAAVRRAHRDGKHVLIEWGGNWCGWCYRLHDVFTQDKIVQPIVFQEFELVLVDSNSNQELMHRYGGADRNYSYPHLTVLDAEGNVLTNQNTEPLEKGNGHDPNVVAEFLRKWSPAKIDAEAALEEALKRAAAENKRVLARFGTPYCGWCKVLAQFLQDHAELFAKDYVDLKIDTLRMTNGEAVASRLRPNGAQGVPWMVILDGSGATLATSIGSSGNIGYPYNPEEIEHFASMLRTTRQNLSDDELETIVADLTSFRTEREERLAAERRGR